MNNIFTKGPEWRKWDLQVHTKGAGKNEDSEGKNIPETVLKRIVALKNSEEAHFEAIKEMLKADEGKIFGVDLVVIAATNRSLSFDKKKYRSIL